LTEIYISKTLNAQKTNSYALTLEVCVTAHGEWSMSTEVGIRFLQIILRVKLYRFYRAMLCIAWTMLSVEKCLSVCLSVRLSNTRWYSVETAIHQSFFHCG